MSPKKTAPAKKKAEPKKGAGNIIYEDEFESFHLSTQEKCEELCQIIIEKLEEAGKKGHMRGESNVILSLLCLFVGCLFFERSHYCV